MKTSSLQFKVLLIAGIAMVLAAVASIVSINRVYGGIQDLDRISREDFGVKEQVLRAEAMFKLQVQEWKNVLLRGRDPAALEQHWAAFQKQEKATAEVVREARSGTPNEELRGKLEAFLTAHRVAGESYRKGLEAFKESKFDPYAGDKAVEGIDRGPAQALVEATQKADDIANADVIKAVQSAERVYRFAIGAIVLAMLAALIGIWLFMRRAVLSPIGDAVRFADRISQGDLTADIRSSSKDEAGQLLRMLGSMKASLAGVVSQVRVSAESVVTASGQV
ncbi:MAG TPA: HAMP domain-containing protein, partial [Usitatibacter sp.]|nr:HAMP domain-containing protein [Usitatibacter sp.]